MAKSKKRNPFGITLTIGKSYPNKRIKYPGRLFDKKMRRTAKKFII